MAQRRGTGVINLNKKENRPARWPCSFAMRSYHDGLGEAEPVRIMKLAGVTAIPAARLGQTTIVPRATTMPTASPDGCVTWAQPYINDQLKTRINCTVRSILSETKQSARSGMGDELAQLTQPTRLS